MKIALAIIAFIVIAAIFIFDFYNNYTGPGTYVLRKLTSGKYPPSKPSGLQCTVAAIVGLASTIAAILVVWGVSLLIYK
jgi:hypothetical protein